MKKKKKNRKNYSSDKSSTPRNYCSIAWTHFGNANKMVCNEEILLENLIFSIRQEKKKTPGPSGTVRLANRFH